MERIMKYLNRVYRASVLDREYAFQSHQLTGTQVSYILHICRREGLTQEELAKSLFVNKSSVTRQLCRLEKHEFITREVDSVDRRVRRVFPTQKAKDLYPEIMDYLEDWNDVLTTSIDEQEQEQLLHWVRFLANRATKRMNDKGIGHVLGIETEENHS